MRPSAFLNAGVERLVVEAPDPVGVGCWLLETPGFAGAEGSRCAAVIGSASVVSRLRSLWKLQSLADPRQVVS